jgi:hypothetical protein
MRLHRQHPRQDPDVPVQVSRTLVFFRYLPVVLSVLVLFIINAACISLAPAVSPYSGNRPESPESPDPFLCLNVVNMSGGPEPGLNDYGRLESVRAAAIQSAVDSNNPVTRDYAVSNIPRYHGGSFNLAQLCDLWDVVYDSWTYVDDPRGAEYFSPASRTIALGLKGDCDDFAIVVAAMIESVGGKTRIVTAANGTSGHAYPEVYVGNTSAQFEAAEAYIRQRYHVTEVGCHITDGPGGPRYWLNLDWWNSHPGGRFFADNGVRVAYYPDGRWEQITS